jgi:hypothetical protein
MTSSDSSSTSVAGSIGVTAWQLAATAGAARVIGVAARGVFLLAPPQRVVFVSCEHYRSPLTINVRRSFDQLLTLAVGAPARFSNSRLIFPSIAAAISLTEDAVWSCPVPRLAAQPRAAQMQALNTITAGVLARRGEVGLATLLPHLLDWPAAPPLTREQSTLLDRMLVLRQAVQVGDHALCFSGLIDLLGQGRGLTPSGDDVVIGLLLFLTRSPRMSSPIVDENMLTQVVASAYQQTTTISANLIECAASGQGDERLITLADSILSGSAPIDECVECVLGLGSSSGIDALMGMAIAV